MSAAGAPPQTPLGELTALPQTSLLDFKGPTFKGRKKKTEKRGKERSLPNSHCSYATDVAYYLLFCNI